MKLKVKFFSKEDIETKVSWMNNPKINETMYFDLPANVAKTISWFEANKNNSSRVDFTFYDEEGKIVAMSGYTGIQKIHSNAEFYIMVAPDCQGKGIGSRVAKWTFNYAFDFLKLYKIYLYTNDDNIKAYALYEKYNFKLEGVLRKHKFKADHLHSRRFYGLLKSEWNLMDWKEENLKMEIND